MKAHKKHLTPKLHENIHGPQIPWLQLVCVKSDMRFFVFQGLQREAESQAGYQEARPNTVEN